MFAILAFALGSSAYKRPTAESFATLTEGIEAWAALDLDARFAVNVGDAKGSLYTWVSKDGFTMQERLEGASLSKWPAAVMISGLVNDGTMSYDDKPSKYLDWWTKDPKDTRSQVTLRHLLSFTSGYTEDAHSTRFCLSFLKCAQNLYEASTKYVAPGTRFEYLSVHLQFAGAMAVAASGKEIQTLFEEYLYKPYNMTRTSWFPEREPQMATGIVSTGDDFEQLLSRLLTEKVLSSEVTKMMETDWTKAPIHPSGDGWFGHYAMGHWWECFGYGTPSEHRPLAQHCLDSHIQAGPGEFGFYPAIDRSGGGGEAGPKRPPYYFSIPLQEPDALSGVPEYLRILAKPMVDLILAGHEPSKVPKQAILNITGGLIRRDIVFIQGELLDCECSKGGKGEPWAAMSKGLPEDDRHENRQDILNRGGGITLLDIVRVHKEVGDCKCKGRKHAMQRSVEMKR